MIAPGTAYGKSFIRAGNGLKTGKTTVSPITKSLNAP
jgi:hypothetical protein